MKRFIWLFLLIGMVSLTGFSTATDSPENSKVVLEVDIDVGLEAVAVATLNFTSIDFVIYERQRSFIINNKTTFLEYSMHKEIWKFENIPLTSKIQNSLKNNRLIFATSGGLSDYCFC